MPNDFDFFYDLGSPYSYLASTQLAGIEQRTGSRARLLPITLGGLRKATGHHLPPPQQLKYMSEDTARWAQQYGVKMQPISGNCSNGSGHWFTNASPTGYGCVSAVNWRGSWGTGR